MMLAQDSYPETLLQEWDSWKNNHDCENERPGECTQSTNNLRLTQFFQLNRMYSLVFIYVRYTMLFIAQGSSTENEDRSQRQGIYSTDHVFTGKLTVPYGTGIPSSGTGNFSRGTGFPSRGMENLSRRIAFSCGWTSRRMRTINHHSKEQL